MYRALFALVPRLCLGTRCLAGSACSEPASREAEPRGQCVPRQSLGTRSPAVTRALFAYLGFLIVVVGCARVDSEQSSAGGPTGTESQTPAPKKADAGTAKLAKRTPAVPKADMDELVKGMNEFAFDLYREIASGNEGNIVISPYSVYTALAMTYGGARGKTAEDMEKGLRISLPPERFHAAVGQLIADLQKDEKEPAGRLLVANSLWAQKDLQFVPSFLDSLNRSYRAGLYKIDFRADPVGAIARINAWVEEQTQGKIQNLILPGDVNALTRFVLANAIYFKGRWAIPFEKGQTKDGEFHLSNTEKVAVPMMRGTRVFNYFEGEGVQLIAMPYLDHSSSMLVVLPDKASGLQPVEPGVTPATLNQWIARMEVCTVSLAMPRYKFTERYGLGATLAKMGMGLVFSQESDFSGIIRDQAGLSGVIHKAHIATDERGTEAAAATAVVGPEPTSMPVAPLRNVAFVADRPFLVLIRENSTGAILFVGRVLDPREK